MNKILIALGAVLALSSTVSFAQSNSLSIGVEGGPNRSSFWGNDYIEQQKSLEKPVYFSAGVSLEYHITELLSLRSAIGYEKKGIKGKAHYIDQSGTKSGMITERFDYDYFTLPLLARVTLASNPRFFFNAGPYIGYLIKQTFVREGSEILPGSSEDFTEIHKRLDLGLTAGLGAGLPVTDKTMLTLELRHNLGLYNISKTPVYNDGAVRTSSTNLLLGLAYKIRD